MSAKATGIFMKNSTNSTITGNNASTILLPPDLLDHQSPV
ncbi:hypothetical protein [Proteiniclasticum ruminis]